MKLRAVILSVFLFLIAVSSAIIISFTYSKNYLSIKKFSQGTIDRVSALIIERIECLLQSMERMPKLAVGFYTRHPEITESNQELIKYFLESVKFHPNLYAFYVGDPKGNALIVFNLSIADKPYYFSDPNKPAPKGTFFAMVLVDRSSGSEKENWTYFDNDLNVILEEKIPFRGYDPRLRPWYTGAQKAGKLYWTDVFYYDPTGDPGIAVAKPVYDQKGELLAIIAVDLSLKLFSHFLTDQPIGKAGKAYILNSSGEILIPTTVEKLDEKTVDAAYREYEKVKNPDFLFHVDREKYLVSIHSFPIAFGKDWLILIIDPLADFFSEILKTQKEVVLISLLILTIAGILVVYFSNRITAPIVILSKEVDRITHLDLDSEKRVKSKIEELGLMDSSIAALRIAIRSFSRYVPKDVVKQLIQMGQEIVPGGEKEDVTVLFTDITEFTPIVESLPMDTLTPLLTEYFDILSKIILKHQGTIDKYIGDGVMVFWGAPQKVAHHAEQACLAALECQEALSELNQSRKEKNIPQFHTRIGINTGQVIIGNIGTQERLNYTAIGDVVNTASRLQGINKIYHTQILIGEAVVKKIGDKFLVRPIDDVEVKGKKNKIKIYELSSLKNSASPEEIELCAQFSQAFEAFHRGDFSEAKRLFHALRGKFPHDYPTRIYVERLDSYS